MSSAEHAHLSAFIILQRLAQVRPVVSDVAHVWADLPCLASGPRRSGP